MKEYLVHIEIKDNAESHVLTFHSSTLTVLFLAIDDFRKAISNVLMSDKSIIKDTQLALTSISDNFQRQLTTVDEQDRLNEQGEQLPVMKGSNIKKEINNNNEDDDDDELQEENFLSSPIKQEPQLKIAYPGAE